MPLAFLPLVPPLPLVLPPLPLVLPPLPLVLPLRGSSALRFWEEYPVVKAMSSPASTIMGICTPLHSFWRTISWVICSEGLSMNTDIRSNAAMEVVAVDEAVREGTDDGAEDNVIVEEDARTGFGDRKVLIEVEECAAAEVVVPSEEDTTAGDSKSTLEVEDISTAEVFRLCSLAVTTQQDLIGCKG
ncbi:hypothetical protein BDR03DRAFT_983274 [Suillus americanus]|nr:hypothetical protein BDR03DRAFT_983274 [Suillus americanus]